MLSVEADENKEKTMAGKRIIGLALGATLIVSTDDSTTSAQCISGRCAYTRNAPYACTTWAPMYLAMSAQIAQQNALQRALIAQEQARRQAWIAQQQALRQRWIAQTQTGRLRRCQKGQPSNRKCEKRGPYLAGDIQVSQDVSDLKRSILRELDRPLTAKDIEALREQAQNLLEAKRVSLDLTRTLLALEREFEQTLRRDRRQDATKRAREYAADYANRVRRAFSNRVDTVTGNIHWPERLRENEYVRYTTAINAAFRQRSRGNQEPHGGNARELQAACDALLTRLTQDVRQRKFKPNEYTYYKQLVSVISETADQPSPVLTAIAD